MPTRTGCPRAAHQLFEGDLRPVIQVHVLPGHLPPSPILNDTDSVIALGSCFARELRHFLSNAGIDSIDSRVVAEIIDAFIEAFYLPAAVEKLRSRRPDASG